MGRTSSGWYGRLSLRGRFAFHLTVSTLVLFTGLVPAVVLSNCAQMLRKDASLFGENRELLGLNTEPDLRSPPVRNLLRGASLGLPSGQAIARRMRLPALTPADVATGPDGRVAREQGLDQESPLWFYVLKEAQKLEGGLRLGPVGSTILAEVFVGLLQGDPASFLYRDPAWTPTLPCATPGCFTMADLLTLVGELNPLGD
jgi:hypothetical protein